MKKELQQYEVHMDFMFMGDEGSEKTFGDVGCQREVDEGDHCLCRTEEVERGMAGQKSDGVHEGDRV